MPTTPRYPSLPHYRSRLIPRGRISTNGVSRPVTLQNDPSQHYSRLGSARSRSKTPMLLQLEVQSDQVQQAAPQKRAAKVAEQIWWQHLRANWSYVGSMLGLILGHLAGTNVLVEVQPVFNSVFPHTWYRLMKTIAVTNLIMLDICLDILINPIPLWLTTSGLTMVF